MNKNRIVDMAISSDLLILLIVITNGDMTGEKSFWTGILFVVVISLIVTRFVSARRK